MRKQYELSEPTDEEDWLVRSFAPLARGVNLGGLRAKEVFCAVMRRARTHAGLTQDEAADLAGTCQSTISNLETGGGEMFLSLLRLHRLMSAYGISVKLTFDRASRVNRPGFGGGSNS